MRIKRIALLLLLLLVASLIAACDDNTIGSGGSASSVSNLSQTYDVDGLTCNYPESWVSSTDANGAVIANSQAVLDLMNSDGQVEVPEDAKAYLVTAFPAPEESGVGPADVLNLFISASADNARTTIGESQEITVGEVSGLKVMVKDTSAQSDGAIYVFRLDASALIAVIAMSHEGQYDDSLTQAIAATVKYTAPTGQ